jgi:hypothetical protein
MPRRQLLAVLVLPLTVAIVRWCQSWTMLGPDHYVAANRAWSDYKWSYNRKLLRADKAHLTDRTAMTAAHSGGGFGRCHIGAGYRTIAFPGGTMTGCAKRDIEKVALLNRTGRRHGP